MTRMAAGRTTHLTVDEIVGCALDLFDESTSEFSMRTLAARLKVSPAALYHHFEKQSDLISAVVSKVWEEAVAQYMAEVDDPFGNGTDPTGLLVAGAVATRRAFGRHPRVAPHIAVPVSSGDSRLAGALTVFGAVFERMGLAGDEAGEALYAYATYVLGSVLLSAHRQLNDQDPDGPAGTLRNYSTAADRPPDAPVISEATSTAIDRTVGIAGSEDEEAIFVGGLRSLLRGLTQRDGTLVGTTAY